MRDTNMYQVSDMYASRPLAEDLEPAFIAREMQRYETRRNPEGLFRSAWNYVEYGLNQRITYDDDVRLYQFDHAQNLLGMTLKHPKTHQDVRLGVLVLSSYIPLFAKRSFDSEVSSHDCKEIYQSLGEAMRFLQPLDVDMPPQWRMAETAVLALSARTSNPELLLYPTSPREETSSNASMNHDSYFTEGKEKIPIQQKLIRTDKSYDEWITVLTLQPLIERGLRKSKASEPSELTDQLNYLLSLIITETSGSVVSREEKRFLDTMSSAVASHRWAQDRARTAA